MDAHGQTVIETGTLAPDALEAAATFYGRVAADIARAVSSGATSVVLALPQAPHDHTGWRRAVARDMARAHAPVRVNVIAGDDEAATAATCSYLAGASGITGQYLPTDGMGAGEME